VVPEPNGMARPSMLGFHFFHRPGIQRPHRAAGHADRRLVLRPAIQTEIALLHLRVLFRTELGGLVRAGLEALVAGILAQAEVTVDYNDAILFPLRYGLHGTGSQAHRLCTVITGAGQESHKGMRILASLYGMHPHPACRTGRNVMPVLAGHHAGETTRAPGLIEVES
jgi:hypothetical protein